MSANSRTVSRDDVLKIIESRRNDLVFGLDAELDEIRDQVLALIDDQQAGDHPLGPLHYDIEQAALNAYSEVQAVRNGRGVFRHADHRAALMAAVDAVDALRNPPKRQSPQPEVSRGAQIDALCALAEYEANYPDGIPVDKFILATMDALVRRGLVARTSPPSGGYRLTDAGRRTHDELHGKR